MKVLIIGSGGREHALAWKVAQSLRLSKLYIAPGNAGTAACGENVSLEVKNHPEIIRFCSEKQIDLVLVGPEVPLADGLADAVTAAGTPCFGPGQAAARIESSKVFAKDFMARHNIPSARYATFTDFEEAIDHLQVVDYPVVIKASGLAAGKGVLLPETVSESVSALRQVMLEREFGSAGEAVVIEERMNGPEVTLLAFSDGLTVKPMPPSQDHKRALDGDLGLNTGGMGAYTPVPVCPPEMVDELVRVAMQPCVDGLRAEGTPFVGVLYGGFMLTPDGPRVVEFNCRFGDPEAEVVLPMLETDLLEIALACVEGRLGDLEIHWKPGAAACVVLASGGYPGKYDIGLPIQGLDIAQENSFVFHAGTKIGNDQVLTAGGRVLCVTGIGESIQDALQTAYRRIDTIEFKDMHYRRDIGHRSQAVKP
jgi:phosphoribosylamine--glycine ligase